MVYIEGSLSSFVFGIDSNTELIPIWNWFLRVRRSFSTFPRRVLGLREFLWSFFAFKTIDVDPMLRVKTEQTCTRDLRIEESTGRGVFATGTGRYTGRLLSDFLCQLFCLLFFLPFISYCLSIGFFSSQCVYRLVTKWVKKKRSQFPEYRRLWWRDWSLVWTRYRHFHV